MKGISMKSFLLICLCLMFCLGCLDTGYRHIKYDPLTGKVIEKWELSYAKAMVTSTITDANLCLSDGSSLSFGKSAFIYDGNDWVKFGQGISASGIPYMFLPIPK